MAKAVEGAIEIGLAFAATAWAGGIGGIAVLATQGGELGAAYAAATTALFTSGIATEAGAIAQAVGSNAGLGVTTRTPASQRQIIRGIQRVGGNIVYVSTTGGSQSQYNMVIVLATHPCEAIENLYLDGRQVYWQAGSAYNQDVGGYNFGGNADGNNHEGPNGVQYNFGGLVFCAAFQGKQTSSPTVVGGAWVGPTYIDDALSSYPGFCSALQANDPTWAPTARGTPYLAGCTYVYLKIVHDSATFPQFPEIRFTVHGKSDILDPRSSTRGYTANWALQVADVLSDPTWGLGDVSINQDQLIAAANVCDEQVACQGTLTTWEPDTIYTVGEAYSQGGNTYTVIHNYTSGASFGATDIANTAETSGTVQTEAQFCCHMHYTTAQGPGDVIETMMRSKEGRLSRIGGEWFIWPPYWQGPSFSFDEGALLDGVQWDARRGIANICNRVTGKYTAPNYPYNVAGNLYDSNGFWNGQTQNNFPFSFQPTDYPMFACDPLHGFAADVYLVADTPNGGAYNSANAYAVGAVVIYDGFPWQANEAVPAGNAPGTDDGSGNPYWSPTGNYLPYDLAQETTLSVSEAQRVASIHLLRSRQEGATTLVMGAAALALQPLDVLEFTSPTLGWTSKLLEVAGLPGQKFKWRSGAPPGAERDGGDRTPALYCEVPVNEIDPSVYEWDDSTEELTPYEVPAYTGGVAQWIVAPPTGLTFEDDATTAVVLANGSLQPRVLLSWTEPADVYVVNGGSIQIQWQDAAGVFQGGAWIGVGAVSGQTTSVLFAVDGSVSSINVEICAVRANGAASAWAELLAQSVSTTGPVALTGAPTAPTASSGTSTTQIATTQFVTLAIAAHGGSSEFISGEQVAGSGTAFTLANTPANDADGHPALALYNGAARLYLGSGNDYTIAGAAITMNYSVAAGALRADYQYGATALEFVYNEQVAGSGTAFTLANTPANDADGHPALALYNGAARLYLGSGNDYTIAGAAITMNYSVAGGSLWADYQS